MAKNNQQDTINIIIPPSKTNKILFLGDFHKNHFPLLLCNNIKNTNEHIHYICYIPEHTNDYQITHIFQPPQWNISNENLLENPNVIYVSFGKLVAIITDTNKTNNNYVLHLFIHNSFAIEEIQKTMKANINNVSKLNIFVYSNQYTIFAFGWSSLFVFNHSSVREIGKMCENQLLQNKYLVSICDKLNTLNDDNALLVLGGILLIFCD